MTNAFTAGHLVTAAEYDADVSRFGAWASGTQTTTVTTSGTTFGAGADILSSALNFTADGTSNYLLHVYAAAWYNSSGGATFNKLAVNLDGNNRGIMAETNATTATAGYTALAAVGFIPAAAVTAGAHTINARLFVSAASTASILATAGGGAGTECPILVAVSVL